MEIIIEKINTNLDGFELYSIFKEQLNTIFLDSVNEAENLGRYSFIGINPFLTVKDINSEVIINNKVIEGDIFEKLREVIKQYRVKNNTSIPFIAGGIGYFSYDICRKLEKIPNKAVETISVPNVYFNFYDNIIITDNLNKETYITALGILKDQKHSIEEIKGKIEKGVKAANCKVQLEMNLSTFKSNFLKKEYLGAINRVKNYIRNGDIYIANLTQRFNCKCTENSFEIYRKLRSINPAPFAAYLNLEGFSILSSSPERFLSIRNKEVQTRPIKGTCPRGKNKEEDERFKLKLINSEKDKSELLMIVDLERNDLSKVCRPGSVKVTELFKLEKYATVFHLVSTIIGKLKSDCDCIDSIKACFPGGSITGAPKIRSMEIIDQIEKVRRNIYTGAIGYIGFDESVDLNIAIRTIHIQNNTAFFGVGGGITSESDLEAEYEETLIKAKALMTVLSNGEM